jgi:hypothetical protein
MSMTKNTFLAESLVKFIDRRADTGYPVLGFGGVYGEVK